MSNEDIVFDEIQYREPRRVRRPDRDRRYACLAYEVPRAGDLPIFLDRGPADAIERHALRDTSVELGGIMLGLECVDDETGQPFVWVTESLEAKHYENTQASFTYTHDSWEEITRQRDQKFPDLDIVGWYHTHPDFGIFLSSHDLFIHRNFFAQPLQVAYVVDPIRQTRGFFRWRDGALEQVGGYYLLGARGERIALSRLANDLESLPNADAGGGGGLSPRLEAELIAMLTRPHTAPASAADRAQLAALFGMLGVFGGALLVALGFWLYTLQQHVQEQTVALKEMRGLSERTERAQLVAIDALLAKANHPGETTDLIKRYAEIREELDELRRAADVKERASLVVATDNKRLMQESEKIKEDLAEAERRASERKAEAADRRAEVKRLDELVREFGKTDKGVLASRYQTAWYLAAGGWGVALLLSLGLVGLWASRTPLPEAPADEPPGPGMSPEPPHMIS